MSDKKQPAQQRVNVRIVKADDPEQRGGMKPIAKADGSLQISPEEACTAGIWTKPPFDLRGLSKMVDESTILPQCIRAYKSNIAGFGIDIRYKDDFADADETPEMKAEWDRAAEVVEMLNMEQESNELFEDIVEARETYGCAYAEVIRDMDGNVIQLEFIEDTPSVEKSRRLDPRVEVTYFHRDHTENRMRKFRKYKQTVNGKTVYYKEFGDPRIMDPTSGEYVTELEFKSRANEIIEFAIGTATYGKVRWVGSILTVDGARRAESLNNNYFLNGRHTPLLIMRPSRGPRKGSRGHSQRGAGADYGHHQQALRLRRTEMARNSVCKTAILFVFGGLVYFGLEVLFRGHSHWTMFVLGGFLFLILGELNEGLLEWDTPLIWQGVLGSAIVTGAELVTGMILNVWLGLGVWDYSGMPFNYKGQICLPFSILWIFVSIAAVVLDDWLRYWLFGEEHPHYTLFRRGESR